MSPTPRFGLLMLLRHSAVPNSRLPIASYTDARNRDEGFTPLLRTRRRPLGFARAAQPQLALAIDHKQTGGGDDA